MGSRHWRSRDIGAAVEAIDLKKKVSELEKKGRSPLIARLTQIGRYAVGITWRDGHDSIYPLRNLRYGCPCHECRGRAEPQAVENARLKRFTRLGESGVYIAWADGHETLYTTAQLRELCRCAYCAGEPERPITG